MVRFTVRQFRAHLQAEVAVANRHRDYPGHGPRDAGVAELARVLGVQRGRIDEVLAGKPPGKILLRAMGFQRSALRYEPVAR